MKGMVEIMERIKIRKFKRSDFTNAQIKKIAKLLTIHILPKAEFDDNEDYKRQFEVIIEILNSENNVSGFCNEIFMEDEDDLVMMKDYLNAYFYACKIVEP